MANAPSTRFMVVDLENRVGSYQWRSWGHANDFYLTPTFAPLTGNKISLHGPNDQYPEWGYRLGIASEAIDRAVKAGGVYNLPGGKLKFPGCQVKPGVTHVVTFRWTRGLFKKGSPSGPEYDKIKTGSTGLVLAPPGEESVTDLDIFVCEGKPWWPHADRVHRDNAAYGPIPNEYGNFLTGVVYGDFIRMPTPPQVRRLAPPLSKRDKMRALTAGVDDRGVLWVLEQWTSFKALEAEFPDAVRPLGL